MRDSDLPRRATPPPLPTMPSAVNVWPAALAYAGPMTPRRRSGRAVLVTVIGVLGIVFGIFSIVSNVGVGAMLLHWVPRSLPSNAAPVGTAPAVSIVPVAAGPVPTAPHPKPLVGEVVGARGLGKSDRAVALANVQAVRPLSAPRTDDI